MQVTLLAAHLLAFAGGLIVHAAKVQSNPPGLGVGDLGAGEAGPGLSGLLGEGEYPAIRQQGEQLHSCPCDVHMFIMLLKQLC